MNFNLKAIIYLLAMIMINSILANNLFCQNKTSPDLPNEVKTLLHDSLSGYIIPNVELFDPEWKSYDSITSPMFACSDFNGDNKKDCAIILLSKQHKTASLFAFVSKQNSYIFRKLGTYDLANGLIDIFISIEKKGDWVNPFEKKHIKNDGFTFIWASKSMMYSYYWDKNDFVKFLYD
jgi:hypothetical protein